MGANSSLGNIPSSLSASSTPQKHCRSPFPQDYPTPSAIQFVFHLWCWNSVPSASISFLSTRWSPRGLGKASMKGVRWLPCCFVKNCTILKEAWVFVLSRCNNQLELHSSLFRRISSLILQNILVKARIPCTAGGNKLFMNDGLGIEEKKWWVCFLLHSRPVEPSLSLVTAGFSTATTIV